MMSSSKITLYVGVDCTVGISFCEPVAIPSLWLLKTIKGIIDRIKRKSFFIFDILNKS